MTEPARPTTSFQANLVEPTKEGETYGYSVVIQYAPSQVHPLGYRWTSPVAELNARTLEDAKLEMHERVSHIMLLVQGGQVAPRRTGKSAAQAEVLQALLPEGVEPPEPLS